MHIYTCLCIHMCVHIYVHICDNSAFVFSFHQLAWHEFNPNSEELLHLRHRRCLMCWMSGFQPETIRKITQSTRFQDWMIHDSWLKKQRVHSAQPIWLDQLCWFDNKIMKKQRNWWLYNGIMRPCKIKDQENRGV